MNVTSSILKEPNVRVVISLMLIAEADFIREFYWSFQFHCSVLQSANESLVA